MVELRQLGGALGGAPEVPNAVTGRDASFMVFCGGVGGPDAAPGSGIDQSSIKHQRAADCLGPF